MWDLANYSAFLASKPGLRGENGVQRGVQSVAWEVCKCGTGGVMMRVDYWPERWERAKSRIGSMPRTKSCGKLWTSQPSVGSTPVSI